MKMSYFVYLLFVCLFLENYLRLIVVGFRNSSVGLVVQRGMIVAGLLREVEEWFDIGVGSEGQVMNLRKRNICSIE